MTEAYRAGKLRAIGVSNFSREDLDNIRNGSDVQPMVNQIHCHIASTPLDLIEYCQSAGIVVEAYCPIAHGEALRVPAIAKMAEKYSVTVAQLCVRYCIQLGTVALPKTENPDHMRNNADLGFEISDGDMEILKHAETVGTYRGESFFSPQ